MLPYARTEDETLSPRRAGWIHQTERNSTAAAVATEEIVEDQIHSVPIEPIEPHDPHAPVVRREMLNRFD